MKKCPQCNTVYGDDVAFCMKDGTELVADNFSLPTQSDVEITETVNDTASGDIEETTVIHHDPIVIDFPEKRIPERAVPTTVTYDNRPYADPVIISQPLRRGSNVGKYIVFLILGFILGGGSVFATLYFGRSYFRSGNSNTDVNQNVAKTPTPEKPVAGKAASATPTPLAAPTHDHSKPADAPDDDFNGRVITANAIVRATPSKTGAQIDLLPAGDRIQIDERENPNSVWFHVTCEHGSSGWMHGDSIEYTNRP